MRSVWNGKSKTILFLVIFIVMILLPGCDDSPTRPGEGFYSYQGYRDWWRIPLDYPYQIHIVDSFEQGYFEKYDPSTLVAEAKGDVLISEITAFAENDKYWLFKSKKAFFLFDITTQKGKEFAEKVLSYMRKRLADYQEETGELFNLEATPAESTSYRLARHDKEQYPDIITSGTKEPFYTNSSQLPVDYTTDVFEALDHQESLQTKYTGGTMFHVYMGEAIKDWETCRDLVKSIASTYRIPFFTISPTYSICPVHGYINGEHFTCPKCKAEIEQELKHRLAELEAEKASLLA